ncbi:MAG: FkbM family methyltransferase [uncultured bacterium]|nr:MAG: FkbM family methyltransferase [uncultured bacterium]KKU15026.1 MAG: Methyltransferase FkbM family protein [Microgenomates group bacterium GW2011_GWC2_45_8]KKU26618.1 MAG: Methyltransferase FkbM family protein [Microgenomates group bacterium GW2011_GWA2_46_16]
MQSTRLGKYRIWYENAEEFQILKREIFSRNDYYVELERDNPVIVDAGAYIGDTVLYFKQQYPNARVVALEPYPHSFALLKMNVEENQLTGVELLQAALAPKKGEVTLHADISGHDWFTTVSYLPNGWDKRQKTETVKVRGMTLSEVVSGPIDLLKMDIEGMELPVLKSLVGQLGRIKNIIAEVHPVKGKLPKEVFVILSQAGYSIEVRREEKVSKLAILLAGRHK